MPHIHTNPGEHDHTATAIIIRSDDVEPKILLHMHKKLAHLMPPGGHIELDETPWHAILHEIKEESGYELDQLELLQPPLRIRRLGSADIHPQPVVHATHPFANINHYHTDIMYAFVTDSLPKFEPGVGESTDLRWLTGNEIKELSADEVYEDVRDVCLFVLNELLDSWERVNVLNFEHKK
jgi:8-oxo-dGTP pyrophosphatase MutT (NUDIX family)